MQVRYMKTHSLLLHSRPPSGKPLGLLAPLPRSPSFSLFAGGSPLAARSQFPLVPSKRHALSESDGASGPPSEFTTAARVAASGSASEATVSFEGASSTRPTYARPWRRPKYPSPWGGPSWVCDVSTLRGKLPLCTGRGWAWSRLEARSSRGGACRAGSRCAHLQTCELAAPFRTPFPVDRGWPICSSPARRRQGRRRRVR